MAGTKRRHTIYARDVVPNRESGAAWSTTHDTEDPSSDGRGRATIEEENRRLRALLQQHGIPYPSASPVVQDAVECPSSEALLRDNPNAATIQEGLRFCEDWSTQNVAARSKNRERLPSDPAQLSPEEVLSTHVQAQQDLNLNMANADGIVNEKHKGNLPSSAAHIVPSTHSLSVIGPFSAGVKTRPAEIFSGTGNFDPIDLDDGEPVKDVSASTKGSMNSQQPAEQPQHDQANEDRSANYLSVYPPLPPSAPATHAHIIYDVPPNFRRKLNDSKAEPWLPDLIVSVIRTCAAGDQALDKFLDRENYPEFWFCAWKNLHRISICRKGGTVLVGSHLGYPASVLSGHFVCDEQGYIACMRLTYDAADKPWTISPSKIMWYSGVENNMNRPRCGLKYDGNGHPLHPDAAARLQKKRVSFLFNCLQRTVFQQRNHVKSECAWGHQLWYDSSAGRVVGRDRKGRLVEDEI